MPTLKEAAQDYEELEISEFSEDVEKYEKAIKENPEDPMNYYYLAKEYILKVPLRVIDSLKDIEKLLKKSLELSPELWAPKIFLGELLFKQGKFKEAEKYFRKVIEEKPKSVSVKEYLARCIEKDSGKRKSEKELLYLFENDLRDFIKKVLKENFGDKWWRRGIPTKTRSRCASRREEGLEEEMNSELILFADFYDYKGILKQNKSIFGQYLDVKSWRKRLNELKPIRNVIAHNRDLDDAFEKIEGCYEELKKIIQRNN